MGYQDAHIIDIRIFGRENPEGKINLRVNDRPFSIKKGPTTQNYKKTRWCARSRTDKNCSTSSDC